MTSNCNKRVTLNRRSSSLLLDYQAMLRPTPTTNTAATTTIPFPYAHNAMSNNLLSPNELPRLLKSSLRTPKSAPCTPSIVKTVQFHDQLEQICLFRKAQTPSAISQTNVFWDDHSSSDEEQSYTTSLVYANWPTRLADIIDRKNKVIRVEKNNIKLVDQDYVQGKIYVRNLSYHKLVTIRYTFDFWETFDNVHAQFYTSQSSYDLFDFSIHLPKNATHLYFAVNYKVGNQEFWDNNDGRNYEIQFVSKPSTTTNNNNTTKEQLKERYDFTQSMHRAKEPLFKPSTSDIAQIKSIFQQQQQQQQQQQLPAAIPIPISPTATRRRTASSPISCNSPLASSPSFMDLNSQSYLDLVNKYCFYSTSPSRSPIY